MVVTEPIASFMMGRMIVLPQYDESDLAFALMSDLAKTRKAAYLFIL